MTHLIEIILLFVFLGGVVSIVALWTQRDINRRAEQDRRAAAANPEAQPADSTEPGDSVAGSGRAPSAPGR
jgi:hypothetical protein